MTERQACRYLGFGRSSQRYRRRRTSDLELRDQLRTVAQERPRWGYRRLFVLLRRGPARRVIAVFDELAKARGYPERITLDNGPEFQSQALDSWAYEHGVALDFIQPGKPIQNALMESCNGRMRDECLNVHWWRTVREASLQINAYREDYNTVRPHSSLDGKTPREFLEGWIRRSTQQKLATATGPA